MKKYLVIGNPIDHSLSPLIHNHWISYNNINAIYEKKKLNENELKDSILDIKKKKIDGINVTVPFKKSVISYVDQLSPEAEKTQSVNTIYLNKNTQNFEYSKIISEGDSEINTKIIKKASMKETNNISKKLYISSFYEIKGTSRNSTGEIESYRTIIKVNLETKDKNNKAIKSKIFLKEFSYNSKDNNYELVKYQNFVRNDLVNKIISEIIVYLNSQ